MPSGASTEGVSPHPRLRVTPCCRATPGISPGSLPPFPGSNMALLTGDSPLPAGLPLSSPMLAPGGSTPDMVYFGTSRPLVSPAVCSLEGQLSIPASDTTWRVSSFGRRPAKKLCSLRMRKGQVMQLSRPLMLSKASGCHRHRCWRRRACRQLRPSAMSAWALGLAGMQPSLACSRLPQRCVAADFLSPINFSAPEA